MNNVFRYFLVLILVVSSFSCSTTTPTRDFEVGQRVQRIALTDDFHLYAQNDVLLETASLDSKLSSQKSEWNTKIDQASNLDWWSRAAGIAQVTLLAGAIFMISSDPVSSIIASLSSIGVGFWGVSLAKKGAATRDEVVREYNESLPKPARARPDKP